MLTKQSGFTLIEVLVALVVMAIGILGVISMHVRTLQYTKNTEYRGVVSMTVNEAFGMMRERAFAALENNQATGASGAQQFIGILASYQNAVGSIGDCNRNASTVQNDVNCLAEDLSTLLPDGKIDNITAPQVAGAQMSLQVSWRDRFDASNGTRETSNWTFIP